MTQAEILRKNLAETLALPDEAVEWLLDLWNATQVLDDAADGDKPNHNDAGDAVWALLVKMPLNRFYVNNASSLMPVLALQVLKWEASDAVERAGKPTAMSYAWRAGFYDTVLLVVHLCHGREVSLKSAQHIMGMHAETLADYLGEFQ